MTEQKKSYIRQLMFLNGTIQSHHSSIENIIETIKTFVPDSGDITLSDIAEDVLNEIIPIYDKYFTEDEVKQLIDFYLSDIGKVYLKNMGNITFESMKIGEKMGDIIYDRIEKNKIKSIWKREEFQYLNTMTEEQKIQLEKELTEELMKPKNSEIIDNFNRNPGKPFQSL